MFHLILYQPEIPQNTGSIARLTAATKSKLHLVGKLIPGYFWIFALPGGAANVGVGMLSAAVNRRSVRLKSAFEEIVAGEAFSHRFREARRTGPAAGWGLPLGSRPRTMAGDGWMLVGDAAQIEEPVRALGIGEVTVVPAEA